MAAVRTLRAGGRVLASQDARAGNCSTAITCCVESPGRQRKTMLTARSAERQVVGLSGHQGAPVTTTAAVCKPATEIGETANRQTSGTKVSWCWCRCASDPRHVRYRHGIDDCAAAPPHGSTATNRAKRSARVGSTSRVSAVELNNPPRITMAIGPSIS